ncbi:MAG: hypothetical protein HC915_06695 [Anaerolineae bacterium]|nr:hypothetical protein [Anaerolineae bacterium]
MMPVLQQIRGDVRLTRCQSLLLGVNARGRIEVNALETLLRDDQPVFFSEYRRLARAGKLRSGQHWVFREATPWLIAGVVRESAGGITRQRYIESIVLSLLRYWQDEQLTSLAIAPLCDEPEWEAVRGLLVDQLSALPLPVIVYTSFSPGQAVEEPPF